MATLILMRHGESSANLRAIAEGGDGDSPLTGSGIDQARRAGHYLQSKYRRLDAIYSSPLLRAQRTASLIAAILDCPVTLRDELLEGRLGAWNGKPMDALDWSLLSDDPHFREHGGESPSELASRSTRCLQEIAKVHGGQTVLIVSHGAAINHGLARIFGTEPLTGHQYAIANTGMTVLDWRDRPRLIVRNDVGHLAQLGMGPIPG